jgi:hypothetical protein
MSGEINRRLDELNKLLKEDDLAEFAFQRFRYYTPKRTGRAFRLTKLRKNEIQTDYDYARVLDEGRGFRDGQMRGSVQAPKGMTEPTVKDLIKHIEKISKG